MEIVYKGDWGDFLETEHQVRFSVSVSLLVLTKNVFKYQYEESLSKEIELQLI